MPLRVQYRVMPLLPHTLLDDHTAQFQLPTCKPMAAKSPSHEVYFQLSIFLPDVLKTMISLFSHFPPPPKPKSPPSAPFFFQLNDLTRLETVSSQLLPSPSHQKTLYIWPAPFSPTVTAYLKPVVSCRYCCPLFQPTLRITAHYPPENQI